MSVLVEQSDVLFARKSLLEVPLRPPARKDHSDVDMNPNRLADYEEVAEGVLMEGYRRPFVNYGPRPHRSYSNRSPFLDTKPARDPFVSEM